MSKKPNILLILTDQQRFDALGAQGNKVIKTPNLDRLASEGVLYEHCMTPSPLCQPARACAVTGLAASRLGCLENNVPKYYDFAHALPQMLHEQGYYCAGVGKMHFSNKPYQVTYGMDSLVLSEETRGVRFTKRKEEMVFDDYDRFLIDHHRWGWDKPTEIGYNEIKPLLTPLEKKYHVTQWCGDETVKALSALKDSSKPFFLCSSFVKPHVPYDCPRHLSHLYDPALMPEPWVSEHDGTKENGSIAQYKVDNEFDLYSRHARDLSLSYYYANITFIDEQIGRILDTLEAIGKKDDTLVIFTSDHGDMMGDHGLFYKCFGFEGSMHVPLLVRYPGHVKAGTRKDDLVTLLDLYPTVLEAAGLKPVEEVPGKSLLSSDGHEHVFSEVLYPPYYLCHLRTKEWKYLFYQNGGVEALYHLTEDPHELVDLSRQAGYRDILSALRAQAEAYIRRYGRKEGVLDDQGHLLSHPLVRRPVSPSPFSRMPWDYRIPVADLQEDELKKTFWTSRQEDWSDHLRK